MKNIYRVETKGYEESNIEYGFIVADNYRNAMEQAMEYYGENETEYITLKYITDNDVLPVDSKEIADLVEKGMNYLWQRIS